MAIDINEKIAITEARSYKVVKSNELIQKARFTLSIQEQKTLLYIISMIRPGQPVLEYKFQISNYCKVCGIDWKNGGNYESIKTTLKRLRDRSVWILNEDGTETTVSWISKVTVSKRSGTISIRLDDDMIPYLFDLRERFTQYELYNILAVKSQYSIRLYEVMRSYAFAKTKKIELEELKSLVSAEAYQRWPDFRRYVLEPAVQDIQEYTDLEVEYEPITKGRKVIQLLFRIREKTAIESTIAQNRVFRSLDLEKEG